MPSTAFGEHLRREREMRGVTLEEVAAATRISTRFLEAIENEQWDRLPGGAFNRGFIRSIARFLGLDEDSMVAEYALETKSLSQTNVGVHGASSDGMPRDWKPVIVAVVAVLILIIAAVFAVHYFRRSHAQAPVSLNAPAATSTMSPATGPDSSAAGAGH